MALLDIHRDGAVVTAAMNNPPFNFLTSALVDELDALLDEAEADPAIRAVVLTSAVPGAFVSHYDVAEILEGARRVGVTVGPMLTRWGASLVRAVNRGRAMRRLLERTPAAGIVTLLRFHRLTERMRDSDLVCVAAIGGMALGGGCELALACDIRLMAEGPHGIGQPEVLLGLVPGGGGTQLLTRAIGAGRTVELALEGRPLTPAQAAACGLVHRVVAPEALLEEAQGIAARLATRSPAAVKAIKHAVYRYGSQSIGRGLEYERAQLLSLASRTDTQHAITAYLALVRQHLEQGGGVEDFADKYLAALIAGTPVTESLRSSRVS
ncbi:enoyl-CoA hydratase/isomerase family protein [Nocardia sp. CDC159]|uniref:Enoyl-CoA hydratase/isomerase family protein n=1 Tax=Nocardia pulmonis TaxID=2951408 RepID=A0A9X2E1J1_9NOCA|nr:MULTISPECIES: enoyl-CoA hydratase/isomerase family protein [Nocardia]MCM6771906.1 enoyl-CoA hydratase/isomerase family protein [Nocardia pulmonis]MCM6785436.1 enoyl-CoA hydratase/isomerase family protein [Nocardia sp. CDC159]